MRCYVYRSLKKRNSYLYLLKINDFSPLPEALVQLFGEPEFAFVFELIEQRLLAQADSKIVLKALKEQGFYLQLPAGNEQTMEVLLQKMSQSKIKKAPIKGA